MDVSPSQLELHNLPKDLYLQFKSQLKKVMYGKSDQIELVLIAALSGGHVLLEDVPGVGKTTLSKAISVLLGGEYQRIQFTADCMPSDLTGVNIFNPTEGSFTFHKGPLFSNIVLADEINRASPRAQSSLLEAMGEYQVSIDRKTYSLPHPFWVIATQNPLHFEGTFPLPESQLDRFMLSVSFGYLDREFEYKVLKNQGGHRSLDQLTPLISLEQWTHFASQVEHVQVSDELIEYILSVLAQSRQSTHLRFGLSTRGALAWQRAAQTRALLHQRNFVSAYDLKFTALAALTHRIAPFTQNQDRQSRIDLLTQLLAQVQLPT